MAEQEDSTPQPGALWPQPGDVPAPQPGGTGTSPTAWCYYCNEAMTDYCDALAHPFYYRSPSKSE